MIAAIATTIKVVLLKGMSICINDAERIETKKIQPQKYLSGFANRYIRSENKERIIQKIDDCNISFVFMYTETMEAAAIPVRKNESAKVSAKRILAYLATAYAFKIDRRANKKLILLILGVSTFLMRR